MFHKIASAFRSFKFLNFRRWSLTLAESFDAWRIVPRTILYIYAGFVWQVFLWYKSIPFMIVTKCDAALYEVLSKQNLSPEKIETLACTVSSVIGGPTTEQTVFLGTVIGLAGAMIKFYMDSGRKWDDGLPVDIDNHPKFKKLENENKDNCEVK